MRSERCCCCCCSVNDFDTTLITKESAKVRERQRESVREPKQKSANAAATAAEALRLCLCVCVSACSWERKPKCQVVLPLSFSSSLLGSADVLALWLVLLPASASRALIPFHFIRSSASVNIPTWRFSRYFARTTNAGFGNGFGLGLELGSARLGHLSHLKSAITKTHETGAATRRGTEQRLRRYYYPPSGDDIETNNDNNKSVVKQARACSSSWQPLDTHTLTHIHRHSAPSNSSAQRSPPQPQTHFGFRDRALVLAFVSTSTAAATATAATAALTFRDNDNTATASASTSLRFSSDWRFVRRRCLHAANLLSSAVKFISCFSFRSPASSLRHASSSP